MQDKLDLEARLDIADLFSRYCHRVDSGDSEGWAALFTADGVFEVPNAIRLEGRAQLRNMPGVVAQHGGGKWRHQVMNVVAEAGATAGTALVRAYGAVTDCRGSGTLVSFSDYRITLRRVESAWLIENLIAVQALEPPATS